MEDVRTYIQKAIDKAGSQRALADAIGISQQSISYLVTDAKKVPAEVAVAIDKYTEGEVSKSDLRPDLWSAA